MAKKQAKIPVPEPTPAPADQGASVSIDKFPELVDVLPPLAAEYRALCRAEETIKLRKKELAADIEPLLLAVDCMSINGIDPDTGEPWYAMRSKGGSSKLDPKLLLARGVGMDVIADCTVKKTYYYIQVRGPQKGRNGGSPSAAADFAGDD